MTSQDQRYALVHDGTVFVCLTREDVGGNWESVNVSAVYGGNEVPFEARHRGQLRGGYWFTGPGDDAPDALVLRLPERRRTIGYKLTDDRLKGTMPETLTPEEYRPLWDDESTSYDPVAVNVYEAVTEPFTEEPKTVTGFLRLDGQPWPETGFDWSAEIPYELGYQPAYLHLFPGHIAEEFPKALEKHLEARGDVPYCFVKTGYLETHVQVGQVQRKIEIRVPYRIVGATFAQALEERARLVRDADAQVDAITQHVCPTCNGSGTDIPKSPEPKRRRRGR